MEKKKRDKKGHKKFKLKKLLGFSPIIIVVSIILINMYWDKELFDNYEEMFVAGESNTISLFNDEFVKIEEVVRGAKVNVYLESILTKDDINYFKIKYNDRNFYISEENLARKKKDIIKEKNIYVRTPATIYKDVDEGTILGLASKGEELKVTGYNNLNEDGTVDAYKINYKDNEGYVYNKYVLLNYEEAVLNYEASKYYDVHNKRGDRYGGGHAGNLDYYPVNKPIFTNNVMPNKVYALYLNNGKNTISKIDEYIEYAKTTKINAFVVDIKDNQAPGYKSEVFKKYSQTNYKYAHNSFEDYKKAIKKIKDAGFYVIGRITVFKDKYYVLDNKDTAILNSETKEPYLHSGTYWPSPYHRKVWEFNVELAKEAVLEMGFNEIQFDYVRFPDRTIEAEKEGLILFGNDYNEDKAQAIQRFVMYACDEIHKLNAYVSVDVFGESAYTYVTAYGQYWAAISNVVDVISGMPYPDHFNRYEFGFNKPVWTIPYDLLYKWGSYVMERQKEIPTPAKLRTWVEVYDARGGSYPYGVTEIDAEIRGLFDAGLDGGYMTWLSNSSLERYKNQKEVYSKEY